MKDIMTLSFENNYERKREFFVEEDLSKKNNNKLVNNKIEKDLDNKDINNECEDLLNMRNNNNIISYYYNTVKNIKNSKEYKDFQSLIQNSKNYIPKIQYNFNYRNSHKDKKYNEKYINNYQPINNYIYGLNKKNIYYNQQQQLYQKSTLDNINKINTNKNNNVIIKSKKGNEKSVINGYFENLNFKSNNIINDLNCHCFNPSFYNNKNQEKDKSCKHLNDSLSKDKESDSTSAISEKKEEEHDSDKSEKENKNIPNLEKVEYLVEMFGRKGWICKLCNNFNYETRIKCNRCGITKRPPKLVDLHSNFVYKECNEQRNIKKEDWICINCGNLNYSFRNFCNRCKIPKIHLFLYDSYFSEKNEMNNFQNYPGCSFSPPSFITFDDASNIEINNLIK